MINIRKGTFETNSSSTHSICVTHTNNLCPIPEKIEIDLDNYGFGWEYEKYNTTEEKLAYLLIGAMSGYKNDFVSTAKRLDKIVSTIKKWVKVVNIKGIEVVSYGDNMYFEPIEGYVDHRDELDELVGAMLENEELLKRYLFSDESFILTGNDNSFGYPDIRVPYEHSEFYKGN